jgi:endonuclease III
MKKYLFLTLLTAVISTTIQAQGPAPTSPANIQAADDATMLKQAKEKQVPPMVEKTGLTTAQAERVIEINFEIRQEARSLAGLSEEDRKVKLGELKALKEKKYSEVLSADQIKAVYAYYEEMGKNREKKAGGK